MKKKKIVNIGSVLLTWILVFSQIGFNSATVMAISDHVDAENIITTNDLDLTSNDIAKYKEENIELFESLKTADEEEYDEFVEEFLEKSADIGLVETLDYIDDIANDDSEIVFENNLMDEYVIDEDTILTITPTEVFLDLFEESEEIIVTDTQDLEEFDELTKNNGITDKLVSFYHDSFLSPLSVSAAAVTKRKTASHSRTYYARIAGQKVVSVGIGSEFTYNGTKVTARTTQNYTKIHVGALGTWQLKSKKNGIQTPSTKRRIAYQEATFVQGLTVKGNGLAVQSRYLRANVESNQNGVITKSSVSR